MLSSWQLLADLSFADLLLWCRLSDAEGFLCVGQMRPYTAQTLHPEDLFGTLMRDEELPVIDRAFHEAVSWKRDEPVLIDGVPVQMEAVPVLIGNRVIAVMTKEGAPLAHRRQGRLEHSYLECAAALTKMVEQGNFPFTGEALDPEVSPRVGDGMLRLDTTGRVVYASPNAISAYRRLGVNSNIEGEMLGDLGIDLTPAALALSVGMPAEGDAESGSTVVLQRAIPFIEEPGRAISGGLILVRDVTELRHRERQLQRKEAVIREVHHRVKNNLQTIASLLRLQSRRLSSEAKAELEEAVRRIAAIALVHETLSKDSGQSTDFAEITHRIVAMVSEGLTHPSRKVSFVVDGDPGQLPADMATPLAVVLVELLQNAVEHAFSRKGGTVNVSLAREGNRLLLQVSDNGKGLPKDFSLDETGLGLQIVRALVESELGGTLRNREAKGTSFLIDVPTKRRAGLRP